MKQTNRYILRALLPLIILTGCEKGEQLSHEITFDVMVAGDSESATETKAAGRYTASNLNSIGQFTVWGYDVNDNDIKNRTVKRFSSGDWGFEDCPMIWIDGHVRTFWASANLPSYVTFANNSKTQSTVTVTSAGIPTAVADQWDPLVGYYSGNGNSGKAEIIFYHPFTAVKFKTGNKGDAKYNITGISSVTMKNVHKSGTGTTSDGSTYSWTGSGTVNVTGGFTGTESTVPFILIPQNLGTNNVTLEITVTRSSGGNKTMYATLNSGSWAAGKLNVYTLNYINDTIEAILTVTLEDWGAVTNNNGTPSDTSDDKTYFDAKFD